MQLKNAPSGHVFYITQQIFWAQDGIDSENWSAPCTRTLNRPDAACL